MKRLTGQWGNNPAVPSQMALDFVLELDIDKKTWKGLVNIFNRLAAYENACYSIDGKELITPTKIKKIAQAKLSSH